MRIARRFSLLAAALSALAGCSHAGDVTRVATDFNRAIADSRNQQTLLNVVRASAREPLQFTAIGEVTATVNRTVGLDTVATNLITGGRDAISPALRIGASTVPVLRMTPLANKEFVEGLLKPTTPEALSSFIDSGWDADFLLPLLVASYSCGGERFVNSGEAGKDGDEVRRRLIAAAPDLGLHQETPPAETASLTVPSADALSALGSGPGGYKVDKVEAGPTGDTVRLTLKRPARSTWTVNPARLCGAGARGELSFAGSGAFSIQLRSPEGILYFLGEAMRPCYLTGAPVCEIAYEKNGQKRYLFRIFAGNPPAGSAAVTTELYGRHYWIPRLDAEDRDRSLKTLTFIAELIALQSNPVPLSPSLISIPQ